MKKKVYIVPHTHWDREWMFSEQTGNVLLNQMINELQGIIKKDKDFRMVLDGQASLLDDYLSWNPNKKDSLIKELKKNQVALGPWYSQPDVFSSMGETTIRNIEVGKKTITDLGLKTLQTAYLPDTFGFNQNLPQIFLKNNLKQFVHWRGLDREQIKNFPIYKWEGIDGSTIIASNYVKGYYCFGMYYPYRNLTDKNFDEKVERFITKTKPVLKKYWEANPEGPILLPLGGDQAPAEHNVAKFIKAVNNAQDEVEWIITSEFDDFFDNYRKAKLPVFKGDLRTPIAGKIHRTIASARYDIKKQFRKSEIALYYKLEPLEILYSQIDSDYDFSEYKLNTIIKPLLKLQAHDSLGGCNTDITNNDIMAKSLQVYRRIVSLIDLITYKICLKEGFKDNKNILNVFNQMPNKRSFAKTSTIYSDLKEINYSKGGITIKTLESSEIGYHKPIFKHKVFIEAKNLNPMSYKISNMENKSTLIKLINKNEHVSINGDFIKFKVNGKFAEFKFAATEDMGDNYDYSPGKEVKVKQSHKVILSQKLSDSFLYNIETSISLNAEEQKFIIEAIVFEGKVDLKIKTTNTFIEKRLSLIFNGTTDVYKTQHLALSKFTDKDETKGWKDDMLEYPALVDHSDGMIQMKGKEGYSVYVKGNNEFYKTEKGIEIVLYRTQQFVSREGFKWRPGGASGISYKENSDSSKLLRDLEFDFRIGFKDDVKLLNDWYFEPIYHYKNSVHLTAHVHNKFEINDILAKPNNKIKTPLIDFKKVLISKLAIENGKVSSRLVNLGDKPKELEVFVNKKQIIKFKKHEYKETK